MPPNLTPAPQSVSTVAPLLGSGWLISTLAPKLLPLVRSYGLKMLVRYAALGAAALSAWALQSGFMQDAPASVSVAGALVTLGTFALDAAISLVSHRLGLVPKALPVEE